MPKETPHSNSWFKPEMEWPTPEPTTKESMRTGIRHGPKLRSSSRKQLNFQSYPINDYRFTLLRFEPPFVIDMRTTYTREFMPPGPIPCEQHKLPDKEPDPLFNRKPINDFQCEAGINHKFMDDHMANLSEARKKINFFRQLRNKSFEFA